MFIFFVFVFQRFSGFPFLILLLNSQRFCHYPVELFMSFKAMLSCAWALAFSVKTVVLVFYVVSENFLCSFTSVCSPPDQGQVGIGSKNWEQNMLISNVRKFYAEKNVFINRFKRVIFAMYIPIFIIILFCILFWFEYWRSWNVIIKHTKRQSSESK